MKRKLFSLLALLMVAVTGAWADVIPTYNLSVGTNDHGTVKFYVGENEVTSAAEGATVTVVITPNTGWVVNMPSGLWYAAIAKAPRRAQTGVDLLKDFELTKLLGQDNTWSFVMQRANAEISVTYKKLLTNQDITIEDITALTYTGVAQEPVVTVKDGSVVLTKDVDYTVTYSNNINAALSTATENAPTVTITAVATSDKYAGETTKTFTILPKALEDGFIANIDALVYTGVAQTPEPAVTYNNMTLVKGTDFTYSYTNNVNVAAATAENAPTVTVTGKGNYTGTAQKKFDITKKALTVKADNKSVTFGDDAPQYTVSYDGFMNNETAAVLGGTLAFACDYVKNQSGAGNYDITPSGLTSSNYDITFTKGTLTVGKKALENSFIADIASLVYNGVAQEPAPVVTFNGMTLVKGTDYSVSYENNVNVGTATATVTALANSTKYSGTASKTFSITKKALTVTADNKSVTFGDDAPQYTVSYDGFMNNETAAVLGGTLAFACDYVKNQSGAGNYDITPSGLTSSNYDITFTKGTLTVGKKALENSFIADIASLVYNGVAQEPAPVVTFNGMTLVKGTDYSVSYENNVNVGTATATVTALANSTKYSGSASKTFVINPATLTGMTLAQKEFTYNFTDPQLQTATAAEVKAGNLIVPATDYDITDNTATELGNYTAKVTGKNNFTGSVTADFAIVKEEMGVEAEETESGKEVDDVTMTVSVVDRTQKQLTLDVVNVPDGKDVIVEIPAQINGWDVIGIADGAVTDNVTDVYMPNTGETAINVTDAAMGLATVHVDIQLLDNYAKMLPTHVGKKKVVSEVTQTAKRFWSFSCGVDVELPAGVTANIVKANSDNQVTSEPIKENVVKANNGVLLEGEQGVEYQITALPATSVGNDYAGNLLEPVVEKKHYGYGQGYYILKDGKFYAIANDAAEVPSCKAVMHIAGASARVITIDFDEATGVGSIENGKLTIDNWYDLNGRKLNGMPTKKGLYIMNGKKVVVK